MAFYAPPPTTFGASFGRPTALQIPKAFDPARKYPLILLLHSFGQNGLDVQTRLQMKDASTYDDGVFLFAPNAINHGTANPYFDYWTALAAGNDYDFVVNGLVLAAISAIPQIDTKRVWVVGYSNGALFAIQLSQQFPDLFTGGFTFAGAGGTSDSIALALKSIPWGHFQGGSDVTVNPAGDPTASSLPGALMGHGGVGSTGYANQAATAAAHWSRNGGVGAPAAVTTLPSAFAAASTASTSWNAYPGTNKNLVQYGTDPSIGHTLNLNANMGQATVGWLETNHRST